MKPEPKGKGNEIAEAGAGQKRESGTKKVQNAITVKSLAPKMLANKPEGAAEEAAGKEEELDSGI